MKYADYLTEPMTRGVNIFGRIVSPNSTFVRRVEPSETLTKHDFQGMYIIPPGSSFSLFFLSPENLQVYARVAFGWWEEKA